MSSRSKAKVLAWAETLEARQDAIDSRKLRTFETAEQLEAFEQLRAGKTGASWKNDEGKFCCYDYSGEAFDINEVNEVLSAKAQTEIDAETQAQQAENDKVAFFISSLEAWGLNAVLFAVKDNDAGHAK